MSVDCVRHVGRCDAPRVAIALAALLLASLAPGCGAVSEPSSVTSPGIRGSEVNPTTDTMVTTTHPGDSVDLSQSSTTSTRAADSSMDDWGAPPADVVAAFAREADRVDLPIYVPSRLPSGSAVLVGGGKAAPLSKAGARSVVGLTTDLGWVEVAQGIEGDVGDLPGEPCGDVSGHPALVYRMAGGYLVQWSDPPWLYGVFSDAMSKEAVISLARTMVRYPYVDGR